MDTNPNAAVYQPTFPTNVTYSLTLGHVAKISVLAESMGISKSEAIRKAIDALYVATFPADQTTPTPEAE